MVLTRLDWSSPKKNFKNKIINKTESKLSSRYTFRIANGLIPYLKVRHGRHKIKLGASKISVKLKYPIKPI